MRNPPRELASTEPRRLDGPARRGVARRRARAPARDGRGRSVPAAQPDRLPHLLRDLRDARPARASRCGPSSGRCASRPTTMEEREETRRASPPRTPRSSGSRSRGRGLGVRGHGRADARPLRFRQRRFEARFDDGDDGEVEERSSRTSGCAGSCSTRSGARSSSSGASAGSATTSSCGPAGPRPRGHPARHLTAAAPIHTNRGVPERPALPIRTVMASRMPVYRGRFGRKEAERLLWRAGFGPKPGRGGDASPARDSTRAVDDARQPAERAASSARRRPTATAPRSRRATRGATTTSGGSTGWCARTSRSSSG